MILTNSIQNKVLQHLPLYMATFIRNVSQFHFQRSDVTSVPVRTSHTQDFYHFTIFDPHCEQYVMLCLLILKQHCLVHDFI